MEVEKLAAFRVQKPENERYAAIAMTAEQAAERRAYMRQMLRNTQWADVQNHVIDNMRLWTTGPSGYYVEDAKLYHFYIPDKAVSVQMASFRRVRSMIPFEYMALMSKDFDWSKYGCNTADIQRQLGKFVIEFEQFCKKGMGLYIYSKTKGSGKTMLASIVLNEISKRYAVSTKFVTVLDLIEMTKRSFNEDDGEVRTLHDVGVLVLDDLGVQMKKEWIDTVLYRLIDHRYRNKLVTIYTSNIHYSDLKIDDRITDRINATSYLLQLPEVPVRHRERQREKETFWEQITKKGP